MKKTLLSVLALFGLALAAQAQLLEVTAAEKVQLPEGYGVSSAALSPDGSFAIVAPVGESGLAKLDLATGAVSRFSETGSPSMITFSGNTVLFRESSRGSDNLRYVSLKAYDAATGAVSTLASKQRNLQGYAIAGGIAAVVSNGRMSVKKLDGNGSRFAAPVLSIDRGSLCVTVNGVTKEIKPLGEKCNSYLWPTLSPDGKRIACYGVGTGAFTCDLEGSDVRTLGVLRAVKWVDDNVLVGMDDEDNGYVTTKSAIIAVNADGSVRQTLTTPDVVAVFPTAAAGKLAFTTPEGEMYIMSIK